MPVGDSMISMPSVSRPPNTISAAEVNAALRHTALGDHVQHFAEVGSTNDLALQAAQAGVPAAVWVADAQTAGRGRGGHNWHSAPGDGLYVSALFTPRLPASALKLSLLAGLAAWQAIRDVSGLAIDLRWPNDLVTLPDPASGRSRKLGGILVETAVAPPNPDQPNAPAMLRYAVIGIGINVAHGQFPPALVQEATSLRLEGWQAPDRQPLLIALLEHLQLEIRQLEDEVAGLPIGPGILARLPEASTWLRGKRVHVPEDGGYTGTTAGLDASGFLLVEGDDGARHTVRSGGVREL